MNPDFQMALQRHACMTTIDLVNRSNLSRQCSQSRFAATIASGIVMLFLESRVGLLMAKKKLKKKKSLPDYWVAHLAMNIYHKKSHQSWSYLRSLIIMAMPFRHQMYVFIAGKETTDTWI